MDKILLVGPIPPPIGGVTIHVSRLREQLELSGFDIKFCRLKKGETGALLRNVLRFNVIHLHTSSSVLRLLIAIICFFSNKTFLFTIHGDLGRYGPGRNFIDKVSIKLASIPIVLNEKSYRIARKINRGTRLISAFIPPVKVEHLDAEYKAQIFQLRQSCEKLFCTNAYNVTFDRNGDEIYQISTLVALFNNRPNLALIISDPSGQYRLFFEKNKIDIASNILLISQPHDFNAVLKEAHCMIRYTTTDGDSLSVKEALLMGKHVIASDVTNRPTQVVLVKNDTNSLKDAVDGFSPNGSVKFNENGFEELLELYKQVASNRNMKK